MIEKTIVAPSDITIIAVPVPRSEIIDRALATVQPCQVAEFHERMRLRVVRAHEARVRISGMSKA